jgi:alpha-L-fucosidase
MIAASLPLNAGAAGAARGAASAGRPRPTPQQLAWQREELAMFIHFTVNTFTGREWGDGTESPRVFDPLKLDARQWARTAKQCGFGSMVLTAKHHDGFCLWPTRTTEHCVRNSSWRDGKGDVVREFVDACRAEGLGVGFYLSPWDRNASTYGQGEAYNNLYIAQLEELLTRYGELVEIWFDGANGEGPNGKRQTYDWPRIHGTVRRMQPNAVIFGDAGPDVRWIGNERGEAGATCWSTVDPKRVPYAGFDGPWVADALMQGDPQGSEWRPGEADVSIRPGWFWHANENEKVRTPANLMDLYFKSVGRNSKLLLNVPPTAEGLLHDSDVRALEEFAEARRHLFRRNLLEGASVRASGGNTPTVVLDRAEDRHWQAPAGERSGWIEFELPGPITFDVLRLEEAIDHGQHIANHRVEAWQEGAWQTVCWGTTIGNARLARFALCTASRIRVSVDFAYDTPRLRRIALYRISQDSPSVATR